MKNIKKEKVKRGKIILSAILTMLIAIISLGFGAYLGYVTLSLNYITIGTMTPAVGGLLVCAGFFIFFGCIGGVISLKEIFISSRNEEKFSAYKPALVSAMIYYVIIAIISIIGIIVALVSFIPSSYTWSIAGLALLTLLLCAGAFYLVLKEMKEHKKKQKAKQQESESPIANNNLSAREIKNFSSAYKVDDERQYSRQEENERYTSRAEIDKGHENEMRNSRYMRDFSGLSEEEKNEIFDRKHLYEKYLEKKDDDKQVDFVLLAERLMQLEELRKAGLINDQEYQALKKKCI